MGAIGLNANTYPDMTVYYVTLPANRLEGWFWMESDRLANPVFREFYKEIEVVREERRLRIESTPTGSIEESIRSEFWDPHPYAWNPQGRPEDVDQLTRPATESFFAQRYTPENLTAAFVGNFDSSRVKTWARQYFGRLPRGEAISTTARLPTLPARRESENRIEATCNCTPQAQVHYPSVGFSHPDNVGLDVLAGVMNGRTGRLYRDLVLGREIAFSAYTRQESWKQAGKFSFLGETKGSTTPAELVQAWDREVDRLQTELVSEKEIARTVNRLTADSFRSLKDPSSLMSQLLYYEGLGGWNHVSSWPMEVRAVTPADIQRLARTYLDPQTRTTADDTGK